MFSMAGCSDFKGIIAKGTKAQYVSVCFYNFYRDNNRKGIAHKIIKVMRRNVTVLVCVYERKRERLKECGGETERDK